MSTRWEPGLVRLHANELPWRAAATARGRPEPLSRAASAPADRGAGALLRCRAPSMLLAGRGSDEADRSVDAQLLPRRPGRGPHLSADLRHVRRRRAHPGRARIEVPLQRDAGYRFDPALLAQAQRASSWCSCARPTIPPAIASTARHPRAGARTCRAARWWWSMRPTWNSPTGPLAGASSPTMPGLVVLRTLSKAMAWPGRAAGRYWDTRPWSRCCARSFSPTRSRN
jgi:hypothetical protein